MIGSSSASFLFPPLSKDAGAAFYAYKAPPVCPSGLFTNCFFEFIYAFLARSFHSPFKMVAQKVQLFGSTGVYQSCFEIALGNNAT
jgi:hypothetical protein